MPYMLQMLRTLMQEHPDRAERLRVHVEALEASIEGQPAFCLAGSARGRAQDGHGTRLQEDLRRAAVPSGRDVRESARTSL